MREILFRGITVPSSEDAVAGNVVYGGLFPGKDGRGIICSIDSPLDKHVVDLETVGQYTGIPDCNGQKILEGDTVVYRKPSNGAWIRNVEDGATGEVVYNGSGFFVRFQKTELTADLILLSDFFGAFGNTLEVKAD